MSATASLASTLRSRGARTWSDAVEHPMVREIGEGSLPHETFRFYLAQNILYLEEYARAIGLGVALTSDSQSLGVMTRLLTQIVENEIPANADFLERAGGTSLTGGSRAMTSLTYDYTRHLLFTCARGPLSHALTALLPCQWSYGEIATRLSSRVPDDPLYAQWIAMFANPAYDALVDASTSLLDRVAPDDEVDALADLFDRSVRYEAAFWQMAYTRDGSTLSTTEHPHKENHHV